MNCNSPVKRSLHAKYKFEKQWITLSHNCCTQSAGASHFTQAQQKFLFVEQQHD